MLFIVVVLYRIAILVKYSFAYVDDDQAIMWYGTAAFAHFEFHEPCFFGQSYGSMIESLLAVPLYLMHVPLKMALPIATLILTISPFVYLCLKNLRNNRLLSAYIILFIFASMSYERDFLTSVPRSFVGGFIFGIIGCVLINEDGKCYKYLVGSYLICLGYIITNTVIALAGMAYFAIILYNKIDVNFVKKRVPALITGNVVGLITNYCIKRFYINNPEYNLHPSYNSSISFSILRGNINNLVEILGWFNFAGIGIISIILILIVIFITIYKKQYKSLIMIVISFLGFMAILSLNKMEDFEQGILLFSKLRMLLFVPYMIALIVYLCFYYQKDTLVESRIHKYRIFVLVSFMVILISKTGIVIKEFFSENSIIYNPTVVNLLQTDNVVENAKNVGILATENNCDIVIQIDDNRAFGYVCGAINYNKFIQYNAQYDRRTWIYDEMKQVGNYRCMLVEYDMQEGLSTEIVELTNCSVVEWLYNNKKLTRNVNY